MKILFVNACARKDSRTKILADCLLETLCGEITELDLFRETPPPLSAEMLAKRASLCEKGDFTDPMFRYAKAFRDADAIVLAAPLWDLSFPAVVKAFFENATVCGLTFRYGEDGVPRGLCRAKSFCYVTTSGGPNVPDFGFCYAEALCRNFFGIADVRLIAAENLDIIGSDESAILAKAKEEIRRIRLS